MKSSNQPRYVFLIGAAKCGTTALASYLDDHPEICVSSPKESDYFTRSIFERGPAWYEEKFAHKVLAPVRLDASVSYTAGWDGGSDDIASRIADFANDALLIYLVRDPIERTKAAYWHARRGGYERDDLNDVVKKIDSDYIQASLYSARIEEYLAYFERDSLKVVTQARLANNPQALVDEICEWIGLGSVAIAPHTVNKTYRLSAFGNITNRLISKPLRKRLAWAVRRHLPGYVREKIMSVYSSPVPELTDGNAALLRDLFEEDVDKLHRQFGIDVRTSCWWDRHQCKLD